eukprot:Rmarinus@m.25267
MPIAALVAAHIRKLLQRIRPSQVRVFDAGDTAVYSLAYSPDAAYIVSSGKGILRIWDVSRGVCVRAIHFDCSNGQCLPMSGVTRANSVVSGTADSYPGSDGSGAMERPGVRRQPSDDDAADTRSWSLRQLRSRLRVTSLALPRRLSSTADVFPSEAALPQPQPQPQPQSQAQLPRQQQPQCEASSALNATGQGERSGPSSEACEEAWHLRMRSGSEPSVASLGSSSPDEGPSSGRRHPIPTTHSTRRGSHDPLLATPTGSHLAADDIPDPEVTSPSGRVNQSHVWCVGWGVPQSAPEPPRDRSSPRLSMSLARPSLVDYHPPPTGLIVCATGSGLVCVYNALDGSLIHTWQHTDTVFSVSVSADATYALAAGADSDVHVYDLEKKECVGVMDRHIGVVYATDISSDGRMAVSAGADNTVRTWLIPSGRHLHTNKDAIRFVKAVKFSHDGRMIIFGGDDGIVRIASAITGATLRSFHGHESYVLSVCFAQDDCIAFSGGADAAVIMWDVHQGVVLNVLQEDIAANARSGWIYTVQTPPLPASRAAKRGLFSPGHSSHSNPEEKIVNTPREDERGGGKDKGDHPTDECNKVGTDGNSTGLSGQVESSAVAASKRAEGGSHSDSSSNAEVGSECEGEE